MAFGIQTTLHSLQSQALAFFPSHTSNSEFVCFFQSFHLSGPDCFCSHRTGVVSLLQILDSILGSSLLYMDLFCWFWVVLFFTWWFRVSGDSMGRKLLYDMHEANPIFFLNKFLGLYYIYLGHLGHYCHPFHLYGMI